MKTYTAEFSTPAEHGSCDIQAKTPEQALQLARELFQTDPDAVEWCSFDMLQPLTEIAILDANETVLLEWADPEVGTELAARELLEALEQALVALNTAPRFRVPIPGVSDSYAVAAICEAAIAKAKGDAP